MISHKHKCIFVHVPKAAGTSIERVFLDDLGLDMKSRHSLLLGENTNENFGPLRVSHLLAKEYVLQHYISQELFDTYYKFSFIRNPIDRLYSTYKFKRFDDYITFDVYIKSKLDMLVNNSPEAFFYKSQYEYLFDDDRNLLVDFVGRFENLNSDFKVIRDQINLGVRDKVPHVNKSEPYNGIFNMMRIFRRIVNDYKNIPNISFGVKSKFLSQESKDLVWKYYALDFKVFKYDFD